MANILPTIALAVLLAGIQPLNIDEPSYKIETSKEVIEQHTKPSTPAEYKTRLHEIAREKGLPEGKVKQIENVIGGVKGTGCPYGESTWKAHAVGDRGNSYGLVQIHLPSHPDITKEQALDPEYALNYIVDAWLAGTQRQWTCYRLIYNQ